MLDNTNRLIDDLQVRIKQTHSKRAHDQVVSPTIKHMGNKIRRDGSRHYGVEPLDDVSENKPISGKSL